MKTKTEDFEVVVPAVDDNAVERRIKIQIPLEWDEDFQSWVIGDEAQRIIDDTKARAMGLILPEQMKTLRERLGYTQKQMGVLFQVGAKSWTRWETGRHRPSRVISLLIRALYDGAIPLRYLLEMSGKQPKGTGASPLAVLDATPQSEVGRNVPKSFANPWNSLWLDTNQTRSRSLHEFASRRFSPTSEELAASVQQICEHWKTYFITYDPHALGPSSWTHALRSGGRNIEAGHSGYYRLMEYCIPASGIDPIREPLNIG